MGQQQLLLMAQQHYRKPAALGGGGNAFDNSNGGTAWAIPAQLDTTGNGFYSAVVAADAVTITGVGTETSADGTVNVVMVVGPNAITSTNTTPAP